MISYNLDSRIKLNWFNKLEDQIKSQKIEDKLKYKK